MSTTKLFAKGLVTLSLFAQHFAWAQSSRGVERPPQFVLLAFDGSYENAFWKESREFSKELKDRGIDARFTYFVSGVYWLHEKNYALYIPPHKEVEFTSEREKQDEVQRRIREASDESIPSAKRKRIRGQYSDIGFGDAPADIEERINQVNLAFEEGHEIGSHGNGHYKGGSRDKESRRWTLSQWRSEFKQFIDLIFNAFEKNEIQNRTKYPSGYAFAPADIAGYRAPTLDTNPEMFQALAEYRFKYDTSGAKSGPEDGTIWPKKNKYGTWMFPLGYINIAGTNKKTASMDYNFYANQSRGIEDKANKEVFQDQMTKSYMKYFNDNYYGNRAPIHIGHHFSKWNGGAYWDSMKEFTAEVCGKPEVRCVTYMEYVNWLESQGDAKLSSYRSGLFSKVSRPADLKAEAVVGKTESRLERAGDVLKGSFKMDRLAKVLNYKSGLKVNNVMQVADSVDLQALRASKLKGSDVVVSAVVVNKQGIEVDSYSVKIEQLGTVNEKIGSQSLEERAVLGDLPEAHRHD